MPEKLPRRPEVEAGCGIARSTIYDWMARGAFPKPIRLGTRVVAWRETDGETWLSERLQ